MTIKSVPFRNPLALAATLAVALTVSAQAEEKHSHSANVDLSKLPAAATKAGVTFDTDIKPIFETSCVKCHGAEKPKAGLRLNSLEATLKGTKEGKVVEPGKSDKSPLLASIACLPGEEDGWMPPKNNKAKIAPLTKEQVGLVRAWIEQGAK